METTQKIFLIVLAALIVSTAFFLAVPPTLNPLKDTTPFPSTTQTSGPVTAFYFYGDGCSHCEKIKPLIAGLQTKYPELNLTRLEIYNSAENRQTFLEMREKYGIASPGVPIIFIGNTSLIGDIQITNRFESEILIEKQRLASCNKTLPLTPEKEPTCTQESPQLSLPLVIFAAIVDSANPCGLSVLVFLLIPMAAAGSRRRILFVGGAYITAMFLFHLLIKRDKQRRGTRFNIHPILFYDAGQRYGYADHSSRLCRKSPEAWQLRDTAGLGAWRDDRGPA